MHGPVPPHRRGSGGGAPDRPLEAAGEPNAVPRPPAPQARRSPRRPSRTALAALAAAAVLPALSPAASAGAARPNSRGLQQAFTAAAEHYRVPLGVLLGVSYLESRWDSHPGRPSVAGGYGPMHLTDLRTALAHSPLRRTGDAAGDARGDGARPPARPAPAAVPAVRALPAALRTASRAAALTGLPVARLRTDPAANIAGGAALLAAYQKALGGPASGAAGDWFGAVARYCGADDTATAARFAADVFRIIRSGAARTTDTGQTVVLPAEPRVAPRIEQVRALGLRAAAPGPVECPPTAACEWVPAPYRKYGPGPSDYGNHDVATRPKKQSIDYIVIHDTEGTWDTALKLVQDPKYLGWHYTVRSLDGHIDQHVATRDVGWHAGNWYVNAKSVGIEHEGYLADPDAWYTEAMYRNSARLVRYLAARFHVPLDRQHVLGHDNVPGPTPAAVASMHTDPGPYWDWAHYFALLGRPFGATAGPDGGLVTIDPDYEANRPPYTGCTAAGQPCAPHGSDAVRLHTAPSAAAPLVPDIGLHPSGPSTTGVNDTGARASAGQRFAVAGRRGDWTAIWYLGQKAWFRNPASAPTAIGSRGLVATPRPGRAAVPVYGLAYPEAGAYPPGVPVQHPTALQYTLAAGQSYAVGGVEWGEYFYAVSLDAARHTVVRGARLYFEIQFGHRVAFVRADDVLVHTSGRAERRPPAGRRLSPAGTSPAAAA